MLRSLASSCKQLNRNVAASATTSRLGGVRCLNVHEYISMEIMQSHGIQTPACKVASTPEEAEDAFLNTLNQRT